MAEVCKVEVPDVNFDLREYRAILKAEATPRDRAEKLRSFPLPIHVKIALLKAYDAEHSTTFGEQCEEYCKRCYAAFTECCSRMELWSHHLVVIEGMFGSGVGSCFALHRSLFLLNAVVFLVFLFFLVLPQALNSSSDAEAKMMATLLKEDPLAHACSKMRKDKLHNESLSSSISSKVLDALSGTGWMEKTIVFFGAYFPVDLDVNVMTVHYNYPLAYLIVVGVSFLANIILLLQFASRCFRDATVVEKNTKGRRYCNSVFARWDYSLTNKKNARLTANMLCNEMVANMRDDDHYEEMRTMSKYKKYRLYIVRALINLFMLVVLRGAADLMDYVQQFSSSYTASNSDPGSFLRLMAEYSPSFTMVSIRNVLPIILTLLVGFEKYDSETEIVVTVMRFVFFQLVTIVFLVVAMYSVITCTPIDDCRVATGSNCKPITCWETYVGQQFYKLANMIFLHFFVNAVVVQAVRALLVKKCKLFEVIDLSEFDIPIRVFDLIYLQIVTWFGSLFSPMLPGVTTLILFIVFYLNLFTCHVCNKPPETVFKAARSNLFFLLVLVFAYLLCILPIGYTVMNIPTSKGCGPFRMFKHMYDVIPATIKSWPPWAMSLSRWFSSAVFFEMIFIVMVVVIYYYATLSGTQLEITHHLQDQVNAESRKKQILFRQLLAAGIKPAVRSHSAFQI